MQADESVHPPKQNSTSQTKPNEKAHGKVYMAAQNVKNKLKDKMKNSFFGIESDDKDESALIIALISSSS